MFKGPTDTTTVGLRLQLCHLSGSTPFFVFLYFLFVIFFFSFCFKKRWAGFYPAFTSSLTSFFLYQTTLSISLFTVPLPPNAPCSSQHACVQSALTALSSPSFLVRWFQSHLQQCHTRTCSDKGRRRHLCYQQRYINALYFNIGRSQI